MKSKVTSDDLKKGKITLKKEKKEPSKQHNAKRKNRKWRVNRIENSE